MAKNEAKIRFTAETSGFNDSIKKANNEMSQLRAEMKLNETQMKATGTTVEGLENKHKILQSQLSASESKTEALNQKVNKAVEIFGENSDEVTKLRTQLLNAQTAEEKLRQAVSSCEAELNAQKQSASQSETAIEKLTRTIDKQQNELNKLKTEYSDAVLQFGKNSSEAQALASKIDSLSSELNENQKKMSEVKSSADTLDNSLGDLEDSAENAGDGFTVMKGAMAELLADGMEKVIEGLGNIGSEAFTMADDIDSATNTFIAKTGESKDSAGQFEDVMTDIYNGNYGESFEDIADSMATVKTSLGELSDEELKTITTDALVLRDTFDMDVNESVRAVNSLMDQFGISADEAFNLVAQGAQNGLNQNGDLLDVINEYSVQFKNAGYGADEMFNMLANGVDAGTWSVDKLGDAVKEFNIRASDGTVGESIKENAKAFGMTKSEAEALAKEVGNGSVGAYQKLREKLLEVDDDTKRYQLGVEMFGTMWEDLGEEAVLALLNTQGEISPTTDALKQIDSVKYDNIGSAIEGIKRNLQTSVAEPIKTEVMPAVNEFIEDVDWTSVGQTIGEVFGVIAESAVAVANGIKEATQWMREHQGVVAAVASVIGILVTAITAYNVVQAIKSAMDAAQVTTVWALVSAHIAQAAAAMAALAPYILIVAAIAAVIAIIVLCVKHWDKIVEAVKKCWEKIKETLSKWGEWINTNVIQPIVEFFTGLWDGIKESASNLWSGIQTAWSNFVTWIDTNLIQPVVNFFTGLWESIQNIWTQICNAVQVAIMLVGSILSAAFQIITSPWRFVWENCKEYVFAAFEWIKEKISSAIEKIKSIAQIGFNLVKEKIVKPVQETYQKAVEIFNNIRSAISEKITAIRNKATEIFNSLRSKVTEIFSSLREKAVEIFNNIRSAITEKITAIRTKATEIFNSLREKIVSIFNSVKSTASSIWTSVKNAIMTPINKAKSAAINTWNSLKSATLNAFNSVKSTATSVWNGVKNAITRPIEQAKAKVKNIVDSIKGFFKNMKLSLPKIKLPHFKITGKLSLNPPSVPKLSIEWYKEGGILMRPTIFGMNGTSLMAGGESGPEAILPIDKLEGYVSNAVEKTMSVVNLQTLANAIEDLANRPIELRINDRQFAYATASASDNVNGLRNSFKSRGLALE